MTYLSGRARSRKKYLNAILGIIAFALFIYFWISVQNAAHPIVEPAARGYSGFKNAVFVLPASISTYFASRAALAQKNAELELMVEHLENQLAQKDALMRSAEDAGLGSMSSSTRPVIVMYPVVEDMTHLYSTVLLSKGYKDGLEKGGLVYIRGQQAVCEIVEVYTTTSLCELLSKGGRSTEGVTSSSSLTLTLVGQGGGNFISDMPKVGDLSVGEVVYLRSNPALVLGTVVSVQSDDQATAAKVYVRGAYNPATSQVFYTNSKYVP
jgi:cell shape-determining protein MreC